MTFDAEFNDDSLENELLLKALQEMDSTVLSITSFMDIVATVKEEVRAASKNGITPGVQFILMHYLGLLDKPVFKNNTKDSKILQVVLNGGNHHDYKKWLSNSESQISKILNISQELPKYPEIQPFTKANLTKVCEIITSLNLETEIRQPFDLLEKLQSAEK